MLVRREQLQSSTHVLLGLTLILKVSIVLYKAGRFCPRTNSAIHKFLVLMAPQSLARPIVIVRIILVDTNAPQPEV